MLWKRWLEILLRFSEKVEGYDVAQRGDTIFPRDLFSLEIISRKVPDWNLDDLKFKTGDLGGDLWLETESI